MRTQAKLYLHSQLPTVELRVLIVMGFRVLEEHVHGAHDD